MKFVNLASSLVEDTLHLLLTHWKKSIYEQFFSGLLKREEGKYIENISTGEL